MELNVQLKKSYGRLTNREPFLIVNDEEYFLHLDADILIKKCIAVFRKGQHSAEVYAENPLGQVTEIKIPDEFVLEGAVECEIHVISHGRTVTKYAVEPIVFARVDTRFEGHPEIEELKDTIEKQGQQINALLGLVDSLNERLKVAEEHISEIWTYEE